MLILQTLEIKPFKEGGKLQEKEMKMISLPNIVTFQGAQALEGV